MTAARMSHEDLTGYAGRLAEMRDEATDPRDVLAYSRALDALRAWSGGRYGERPSKVRLWAAVFRSRRDSDRLFCRYATVIPPTPDEGT